MNNLYASSIDEIVDLLMSVGGKRTVVIEGDMGIGKSTLLKILKKKLPDHIACYFDGTTKDLGDLFLPNINGADKCVSFLPNEQFGIHLGKPIILMLDELGKANPSVKNALLVVMLERMIGNQQLPEGSIVFGTTAFTNKITPIRS